MTKLVMLRHGESIWNKENRFTGWTDVDLSEKGREEAKMAGQALKDQGLVFDLAFTSVLKRAISTLWLALDEMDLLWIPVRKSWRLNERHYGALQGLLKPEVAAQYGEEQVRIWRRSYDVMPQPLERSDSRYPGRDPRYAGLADRDIPLAESLKTTSERFMPYWQEEIAPEISKGKRVLIVAHGNSLRALVKHLDNISDTEIVGLNIPTGIPLVYELDEMLRPIRHYYLGEQQEIAKAVKMVADQGKKR